MLNIQKFIETLIREGDSCPELVTRYYEDEHCWRAEISEDNHVLLDFNGENFMRGSGYMLEDALIELDTLCKKGMQQ